MSIIIGKIKYLSTNLIGEGSQETVVYSGLLGNRKVAVKKVPKSLVKLVDREIELLEKSDRHENVLTYFLTEEDHQFYYIALELCRFSLAEYVKNNQLKVLPRKEVVKQTLNGLIFLHELGIVHRDLKPSNILFCAITDSQHQVKISDFGFSKELTASTTSVMSSKPIGTQCWFAPEVFNKHYNAKSDIYSLGCVFYYVLADGKINTNNSAVNFDWNVFVNGNCDMILASNMIQQMVKPNPSDRPLAHSLLNHPYFWEPERILGFIIDISNRLEKRDAVANNVQRHLEEDSHGVIRGNWLEQLENVIVIELHRRRGYIGSRVDDLIRAIRNKVRL
ncbi:unnamed protein product [Diamesa tonsa]